MARLWGVLNLIEGMVLWIIVPYLVWQQWGWIPAVSVMGWWLVKSIHFARREDRLFQEVLDQVTGPEYYREEEETADALTKEFHDWLDDDQDDDPEYIA